MKTDSALRELSKVQEALNERIAEVRIMKRERDEVMTSKMELAIENKSLKVTDSWIYLFFKNRARSKNWRRAPLKNTKIQARESTLATAAKTNMEAGEKRKISSRSHSHYLVHHRIIN